MVREIAPITCCGLAAYKTRVQQSERERERDFGWLKARVQKKAFDWVLAAYKTRVQQSERERETETEREREREILVG